MADGPQTPPPPAGVASGAPLWVGEPFLRCLVLWIDDIPSVSVYK
jgi:hypothetical protein